MPNTILTAKHHNFILSKLNHLLLIIVNEMCLFTWKHLTILSEPPCFSIFRL